MATRTAVVLSLAGACALSLGGIQASALASPATGFTSPFSGTPRYERFAPKQATTPAQINAPLGQRAADRLAVDIGLDPKKVFTPKQYAPLWRETNQMQRTHGRSGLLCSNRG